MRQDRKSRWRKAAPYSTRPCWFVLLIVNIRLIVSRGRRGGEDLPWSITATKHQTPGFWPSFGKGRAKRSGSSSERRLDSLRSIELPKRKSTCVRSAGSIERE